MRRPSVTYPLLRVASSNMRPTAIGHYYGLAGVGVGAVGVALLIYSIVGTTALDRRIVQQESVARAQYAGIEQSLKDIRGEVRIVVAKLRTEEDGLNDEPGTDEAIRFAALADAQAMVRKLGNNPSAEGLAEALAAIDGWLVEPSEEVAFKQYKLDQQKRLRGLVRTEVSTHQTAALAVLEGAKAAKEHTEAGRILAMYPMPDDAKDAAVIEDAKRLAARQVELVNRLEALRRQRYNRWAIGRIEESLAYYNENVSKFNPLNDNSALIVPIANSLAEVDPVALEPAVLELYNYVIDRTKGSLSEKNKLELAKRLTDPSVPRKTLGDDL
jgi:hypothetical protein